MIIVSFKCSLSGNGQISQKCIEHDDQIHSGASVIFAWFFINPVLRFHFPRTHLSLLSSLQTHQLATMGFNIGLTL